MLSHSTQISAIFPSSIRNIARNLVSTGLPVAEKPLSYRSKLKRHLLPAFGQKQLREISRWDVQRFLTDKRKAGYSTSHVHGLRVTLSKVLQAAVDWELLEQNPARGIRLGDRQPVREHIYLNPPEVRRLLDALPEPCREIVLLLVLTGLRIGELLALRWKHLDLPRGVILVRETVSEGRFGAPKTRSSRRDVPMSAPVQEALLSLQGPSKHTGPEDLLFSTWKGTPLNSKNLLRRVLQPTCKAVGLPAIHWHSFRHSHATLLGEVGESLRTAQALLGHSDLETTLNVYTHPIPESQRRAVEKVAAILFPNVPKFGAPGHGQKEAVN